MNGLIESRHLCEVLRSHPVTVRRRTDAAVDDGGPVRWLERLTDAALQAWAERHPLAGAALFLMVLAGLGMGVAVIADFVEYGP